MGRKILTLHEIVAFSVVGGFSAWWDHGEQGRGGGGIRVVSLKLEWEVKPRDLELGARFLPQRCLILALSPPFSLW